MLLTARLQYANTLSRALPARLAGTESLRVHLARRFTTAPPTHDGPPVTETNRAETTLKRFWKTVGVKRQQDGFTVTLDSRPIKTPAGNTLLLPTSKQLAASLIAFEWENQETVLKPHALPMTSIASRAIDFMSDKNTCAELRASLLDYLHTDTICFQNDDPPQLVELQTKYWDPLLDWARKTFDIDLQVSSSILFSSQSEETARKLGEILAKMDPWELAVMERATYTTKSFIISLALIKGHLTAEQAALASQVEVASQIQRWGEVEDSHDVDFHDVRRQLGSAACLL
ncbi:ATP12-domain-containing protein [Coniophora puteana RWD-64-598 SS2]|uniref:ATP12-domain-containing protein n=1 Tax=Coniophora puteana (strain RWD-64-598) TaxID=741705 RepID=A0A5M3N0P8_CONPW|nr:ATP12-domain-containing protein [Coniophora puteana RWD-64-598 SS2]EIW84993.1 ATP12-domain-containing protein [Coniophora puteana RWD-64-598 SS2]